MGYACLAFTQQFTEASIMVLLALLVAELCHNRITDASGSLASSLYRVLPALCAVVFLCMVMLMSKSLTCTNSLSGIFKSNKKSGEATADETMGLLNEEIIANNL